MTPAPETRYARAADGIHVGYQVVGAGPVDMVFVPYDYSNIEAAWDFPPFVSFVRGLASIGRVLVFDRRGSGTSDRSWTGEAATIEAQMDDIRAVMDAASSERAFLFGIESGASLCFMFAATHPHRTSGVVVQAPMVRGTPAPDYPASWSREMMRSTSNGSSMRGAPTPSSVSSSRCYPRRSCTTRPPCERTGDSYGSAPARETRSPAITQ